MHAASELHTDSATSVLGIDLGEKRTGVATCKAPLWISIPQAVLESDSFQKLYEQLRVFLDREGVDLIVLGLPLETDGSEGTQAQFVRKFCRFIAYRTTVPIRLVDERLTSKSVYASIDSAESMKSERSFKYRANGASKSKSRRTVDAQAAQLILETWRNAPEQSTLFQAATE